MLGEDEAAYLGINPGRLIFVLLVINTVMVAVATATVGVIAFIGLVIPHVPRMLESADYTFLLSASALLGALSMEVIDIVARLIIMPAELPIGIITAIFGAPVFIWILISQQHKGAAGFYGKDTGCPPQAHGTAEPKPVSVAALTVGRRSSRTASATPASVKSCSTVILPLRTSHGV